MRRNVFVPYWCPSTSGYGWVNEHDPKCPGCGAMLVESIGSQGERTKVCAGREGEPECTTDGETSTH